MTGRMCLVLGMGLGGLQSALAEGTRLPPNLIIPTPIKTILEVPVVGCPEIPKEPNYLHTNQDSMMPPGGPPEGPPEGEESRLGDPFGFPFDVPNSTLQPTSVLVVAERLGGTPSWAANNPLPEAGSSPGLGGVGQSTVPGPAGLLLFLAAGRGRGRRTRRGL